MFRKFVKALIPRQLFREIEPFGHLLEAVMWQVLMGFPATCDCCGTLLYAQHWRTATVTGEKPV